MISLYKFRNQIDRKKIKDICGIYWIKKQCMGDGICNRSGLHKDHVWEDEIVIPDKINSNFARKKGEKTWEPGEIYTIARWYNFLYSLHKIMQKNKSKNITKERIIEAMNYAKENCFGLDGLNPSNMAKEIGNCGYKKFLENMEKDFDDYIN